MRVVRGGIAAIILAGWPHDAQTQVSSAPHPRTRADATMTRAQLVAIERHRVVDQANRVVKIAVIRSTKL